MPSKGRQRRLNAQRFESLQRHNNFHDRPRIWLPLEVQYQICYEMVASSIQEQQESINACYPQAFEHDLDLCARDAIGPLQAFHHLLAEGKRAVLQILSLRTEVFDCQICSGASSIQNASESVLPSSNLHLVKHLIVDTRSNFCVPSRPGFEYAADAISTYKTKSLLPRLKSIKLVLRSYDNSDEKYSRSAHQDLVKHLISGMRSLGVGHAVLQTARTIETTEALDSLDDMTDVEADAVAEYAVNQVQIRARSIIKV